MKNIQIASFVGAALVFMFAYFYLGARSGSSSSAGGGAGVGQKVVVVAKSDIAPNTVITPDMIETREEFIADGDTDYFEKTEDVVLRISTSQIYASEKITNKRTADKDSGYSLSNKISKGMRAVTISIDAEKGLASNLRVGDHVDLIISRQADPIIGVTNQTNPEANVFGAAGTFLDAVFGPEEPRNTTIYNNKTGTFFSNTNMQNMKIIALDKLTGYYVDNNGIDYGTITLEVTPQQARGIALIKAEGYIIYLTLRANGDDELTDTPRDEVIKPGTILTEQNAEGGAATTDGSSETQTQTQQPQGAGVQGAGTQSSTQTVTPVVR